MRILANENFPGDAVDALREKSHDVIWIRSESPGSNDRSVLARAQEENRVLITFDKDFGELAFKEGLPATSGVILFRISAISSKHIADAAVVALERDIEWSGHFSVVEDDRIRTVPMSHKD